MKKKKLEAKYSLSKRIVGLTIFLDALFLVIVVVVGLFVFSVNISKLKENGVSTETNAIINSTEHMLQEMANHAYIMSQSNDVIQYMEYINDGFDPSIDETDEIYQIYQRVLLLMEGINFVDETEKEYYRVFLASALDCQYDSNGCLIDQDGVVYSAANGLDINQEPWNHLGEDTSDILTAPYIDQVNQDDVVTYARQIVDSENRVIGYVGVTLSLNEFGGMMNRLVETNNNHVMMISHNDSESQLLYLSTSDFRDYLYEEQTNYSSIDKELGYSSNGLSTLMQLDSDDVVLADIFNQDYYVTSNYLDEFNLDVYVLIYDPQILSIEWILVIVLGIVMILIALIGYITNRTVKRSFQPIDQIIHSIDEIKNGNYSVKVAVKENNEIKDIGDAINLMSDEIERQIKLVYDNFAYDQLTGLKNKAAIVNDVNQNLLIGERKVAVCLLQVDNLKDIIIIKGQMMGDSLIKAISKEISSIIGKDEMLYSNGGNELIYIIPDFENLTEVRDKVNRIIYRFKSPIEVNRIKSEIKIYAGIATYPSDDHNLEDLIKKCDVSIYKDKSSEKKQVIFYNNKIAQDIAYQAEVSEQLSQALEKKEIYLKYQPLIDNKSEIYGFEALARWASPVLGSISPEVFIGNAEENYLIIPIGTWILKEACKMQVALRKIFHKEFVISVNVSLIQILQPNYVKIVKRIIKETDINPHYLTLELTESIFINSTVALDGKIDALHDIGVKFSLDDFGTGYASLSYLRNIAFDNLKIDKSFIDGIMDIKKENKIVGTIIQMVHNLDMKVIAEGVEHKSQYEYLKQISADIFQGYLLSKPLDINETVAFVNQFYKIAKSKRVDVLALQNKEG